VPISVNNCGCIYRRAFCTPVVSAMRNECHITSVGCLWYRVVRKERRLALPLTRTDETFVVLQHIRRSTRYLSSRPYFLIPPSYISHTQIILPLVSECLSAVSHPLHVLMHSNEILHDKQEEEKFIRGRMFPRAEPPPLQTLQYSGGQNALP